MKIKSQNKTQNKIKNIIISFVIAIAMLLGSNLPLAFGVIDGIKNIARAEYKPTDHVSPYEFSQTESGWSKNTNAPTGSELETSFSSSRYNINLYDNSYDLKPSTTYDGTGLVLNEGETKEEYAMSIQAKNAPKSVVVDKKDKNDNIVYEKDADGNFLFEPQVFTDDEVAGHNNDYVHYTQEDSYYGFSGWFKKVQITKDGATEYKTDSKDNFIFVAKEYTSNTSGNRDYYIKIDGRDAYNRRIPKTEVQNSYYGYKTSSSLPSLSQDSWYVFSFWAWTSGTDATMVLYSGKKTIATVNIYNAQTQDKWVKYYLFFESVSDTNTNGISTAFNIAFFLGEEKSIAPSTHEDDTVTGAVFVDHICVQKISETDFREQVVTGDEAPADAIKTQASLRYSIAALDATLNTSFQNGDISVEEEMYNEEGYQALADGVAGYQYEKYVSPYTSDSASEERSETSLAEIRDTYDQRFNFSIVDEETEIEEEEKDEDGNPKEENGEVVKHSYNTFNPENKILKLENKSERYDLGLLSANINVEQFRTYRLTLYLKGKTTDDKAIVKLISSIKTGVKEKGEPIIKSQSITPYTDNSDITNNWTEVTFYIQANCFYDSTFQIAILACANSTIYVDNIRFESISAAIYRGQSSVKKFDLAPTSSMPSSRIENANFNAITTNESNPDDFEIPYTPYGWTKLTDSSDTVISGIVSTNENFFENIRVKSKKDSDTLVTIKEKLGNPDNPISYQTHLGTTLEMPRDNVLAIYAPAKEDLDVEDREALAEDWKGHYFGYKSSSYNFSSNSVYLLTFDVYVSGKNKATFNDDGRVFANLLYEDKHVAEISLDNNIVDTWQTYTIVIRTGTLSRSMTLELGVKDATGTVFFQKVNIKQLTEKDNPDDEDDKITVDEQYAEKFDACSSIAEQKAQKMRFVDFDGNSAVMASEQKVEGKEYYSSLSHSLKEADSDSDPIIQGDLGIIDSTEDVKLDDSFSLSKETLAVPEAVKSKNVMFIYNKIDYATAVYPNKNSTLSSSSYYEVTLWVKTVGVPENKGITITMDSISVEFKNVNTQHGDYATTDNNGYTKLTALVKTGTSSYSGFRVSFALGEEDNKTTGVALIAGMSLNKVASEDDYNTLLEAVDENDITTITRDFTTTDATSTADEDADNLTLATFFLVFSSILLVVAIVFAVVVVYIKKVPRKAKTTNSDNNDSTPKEGFV